VAPEHRRPYISVRYSSRMQAPGPAGVQTMSRGNTSRHSRGSSTCPLPQPPSVYVQSTGELLARLSRDTTVSVFQRSYRELDTKSLAEHLKSKKCPQAFLVRPDHTFYSRAAFVSPISVAFDDLEKQGEYLHDLCIVLPEHCFVACM